VAKENKTLLGKGATFLREGKVPVICRRVGGTNLRKGVGSSTSSAWEGRGRSLCLRTLFSPATKRGEHFLEKKEEEPAHPCGGREKG